MTGEMGQEKETGRHPGTLYICKWQYFLTSEINDNTSWHLVDIQKHCIMYMWKKTSIRKENIYYSYSIVYLQNNIIQLYT